jgi:hypothetical protein
LLLLLRTVIVVVDRATTVVYEWAVTVVAARAATVVAVCAVTVDGRHLDQRKIGLECPKFFHLPLLT